MSRFLPPILLGFLCCTLTIAGGEKKSDVKWDMDYLEKTFGIKFKSAKVDAKGNEAKILLEFSKDIDNLAEVRKIFEDKTTSKLLFYFFDDENVAFAKGGLREVEGEITGKAGEAFRIFLPAPADTKIKVFATAKKVSARPFEDPKAPVKIVTNSLGMKFVWIPPGQFKMGSPSKEPQRDKQETQHTVTLTKGFFMGVHPVTQEQWQAIMGENPSEFDHAKNLPVDSVSWEDCQEFLKKLRKKDGKAYRLPSEAEWEYCARAGTTTPYYTGTTLTKAQANFKIEPAAKEKKPTPGQTTPVGKFPANPWGLYDMHGNLYQWCQDWHGEYPEKDVTDPQGPADGTHRVLRAGAWAYAVQYCRSANRNWEDPEVRYDYIGVRVCYFPTAEKAVDAE